METFNVNAGDKVITSNGQVFRCVRWGQPKEIKQENKMAEKIEITVKVNGVETPLYRISEQTLLTVRENSKPEEIPVARTANYHNERRLILKISDSIKKRINESLEVIVIDLKTGRVTGSWLLENDQHYYNGANFYSNVKTIE